MKKIFFILISTALFLSCNQSNQKEAVEDHAHDDHAHESTELTLNNGAKWQADSSTNRHLVSIRNTANMFKVAPFPAVEKYQILGSDIQNGLNSMIQDCTLKGAPDEALHKWFLPIMRQAGELKNVSDTATARPIFDSLDQRINIYYDYFE